MTNKITNELPPDCILIHTDGACSGNPGPGGHAAIVRRFVGGTETKKAAFSGGEPNTTNNRQELMAVIRGLKVLKRDETLPIIIRLDSKIIVDGFHEWLPGWIERDWRKSDKKPVANSDLWQQIVDLTEGRSVTFVHVRGHAGDPGNEEADTLAVRARDRAMQTGSAFNAKA